MKIDKSYFFIVEIKIEYVNPIQDGWGKNVPYQFFPVASTNIKISP